MQEAITLKETKFCKHMKMNGVSPDIFSLLIVHTSYVGRKCYGCSYQVRDVGANQSEDIWMG